jgi:Phosphotransferase enzyme family
VLPITCKQSEPFHVYVTPYGGRPCCAKEFRVNLAAQKNALRDLAIVLAQSCEFPVEEMDINLDTIKRFLQDCLCLPDIQEKVQNLLDNLGNRFQVKADIADKLADLPVVFVHGDFATTNILSDDEGHITGIVDWESSEFLPFGWNFYGVDLFLGEITYHDGEFSFADYKARAELEMVFWHTFWEKAPPDMKRRRQILEESIKISRGIGLLWHYVGHNVSSFLDGSVHFMPVIKAVL